MPCRGASLQFSSGSWSPPALRQPNRRATRSRRLADFNAAVENAAAHNRVALGYLRTDNIDLAAIELDHMNEAWIALVKLYGKIRRRVSGTIRSIRKRCVDVPTLIVTAIIMLSSGQRRRPQVAAEQSGSLCTRCAKRAASKCSLTACSTTTRRWRRSLPSTQIPPDWSKPEAGGRTLRRGRRGGSGGKALRRLGPGGGHASSPEFRRLIDGTLASLAFVPKVIATRDNDLLHRVIGELRAFDNLLSFGTAKAGGSACSRMERSVIRDER